MKLEVKFKGLVLLFALIAAPFFANAQSMEEAQTAYNAGVTAKTDGDLAEAIAQFTTCVETCEYLVEDEEEGAEDLMYQVQAYIPSLHLQLGSAQLKEKKITEGLENLYKAKETAELYGEDEAKTKAVKYITQVHYKVAGSKYKGADYETALVELDKALAMDPTYVPAYYLKTVVYKKQANDEAFKAAATKGIEVGTAKKDKKNTDKIIALAHGHFLKKGNEAKGASKLDEAIAYLNSALEFKADDVTTLYLLSSTYLEKGSYGDAVATGEKAVEAETGGAEAQAKIYMIIAEAQAKDGNNGAACASYKKAAVGQYAELANYRIEHELKCE